MDIVFTEAGLSFLFRMIVSPHTLSPDQPYSAPDQPAAQDLIGLKKWLLDEKTPNKRAWIQDANWKFGDNLRVKMRKRYIERIKEMLKHYQKSGRVVNNVEGYEELSATLEGKPMSIESVEEEERKDCKSEVPV